MKKHLQAVQAEAGEALGLPPSLWPLCAFERNGHIQRRNWNTIYWLIMERVARLREAVPRFIQRRGPDSRIRTKQALTMLQAACKLREKIRGKVTTPALYRTTMECLFYGGVSYPEGTHLARLTPKERDSFKRWGRFDDAFLRNTRGEFFKVMDSQTGTPHMFFLTEKCYEAIPVEVQAKAA